jgi:hypothetical protein
LTTQIFATTITGGSTKTTATSVTETCATITGCNLKDIDATSKVNACTIRPRAVRETDIPEPEEAATANAEHGSRKTARIMARAGPKPQWCNEQQGPVGIVWPVNPENDKEQDDIRQILLDRFRASGRDFKPIRTLTAGITAFYVIENMGTDAMDYFNSGAVLEIFLAYHPDNPVLPPHVPKSGNIPVVPRGVEDETAASDSIEQRSNDEAFVEEPVKSWSADHGVAERRAIERPSQTNETARALKKRALDPEITNAWWRSMASWPANENFDQDFIALNHRPSQSDYFSVWDDTYGQGQTIYILDLGIDDSKVVSLFSLFSCLTFFGKVVVPVIPGVLVVP